MRRTYGQRPPSYYSLAAEKPHLAAEWHPTRNKPLTPSDVSSDSDREVWWMCRRGHEWRSKVVTRSIIKGCPLCSQKDMVSKLYKELKNSLYLKNPILAREWHPEKNGMLTPMHLTPGSDRKVWWICSSGHEWRAHIFERRRGNGCPGCSHRIATSEYCLAAINPKLAGEWHSRKNGALTSCDVTPGADRRVWWQCGNGHEWQARVYKRNSGNGCPMCWIESHRKRTT